MTQRGDSLPFVDEHRISIAAPPGEVWAALERYVTSLLSVTGPTSLRRILGTEPVAGFEVDERVVAERLTLTGRHRFSRYRLDFVLCGAAGTTELRAVTYAEFPGLRGRVYRALVIGSRAHGVAMAHILRSVRRLTPEARQTSG